MFTDLEEIVNTLLSISQTNYTALEEILKRYGDSHQPIQIIQEIEPVILGAGSCIDNLHLFLESLRISINGGVSCAICNHDVLKPTVIHSPACNYPKLLSAASMLQNMLQKFQFVYPE